MLISVIFMGILHIESIVLEPDIAILLVNFYIIKNQDIKKMITIIVSKMN